MPKWRGTILRRIQQWTSYYMNWSPRLQLKSLIYNLTAAQGGMESAPRAMWCDHCASVVMLYFFMCPLGNRHMRPSQAPQVEPKAGIEGHWSQDIVSKKISIF